MSNSEQQNKCLVSLSMAYLCIMVSSELLVNKPVAMPFGYTTAATLIFPFWFILNDIIAEVYGYKTCWRVLLTGFIITLLFNLICYCAIHLPSPSNWDKQFIFDYSYGSLFRVELSTFIAFIISGFINIRLLTRWKVLLSGKHFWLRSIGSSAIGEAIYSILNVWAVFIGSIPLSKIPMIILWSYSLKVIYTILLAYPAMLLVQLLKKIDKVDVYDNDIRFKLSLKTQ